MTSQQLKKMFADLELNRTYFARKLNISAGNFNNKLNSRINNGSRYAGKSVYKFSDQELETITIELRRIANGILKTIK